MPLLGSSTVVCLQRCRSVSFVVFLLYFHTLLHQIVVGPLQYSPVILCSVVLLIFSELDSTGVHFWSVYWLSSITHAQAILIASVCSVGHWYLLSDGFICDAVFIRNPHNFSEPAIFTGIKPILSEPTNHFRMWKLGQHIAVKQSQFQIQTNIMPPENTLARSQYSFILAFYYRATLCVSAVFAVDRCLSVCPPSRSCILSTRLQSADIVKLLCRPGSPINLILIPSASTQLFQGKPLQRGRKVEGCGKILRFSTEIAVYLGNGTK